MGNDLEQGLQRAQMDRRRREQAVPFWTLSLLLTIAMLVAYPPTVAVGEQAGLIVAIALGVLTAAYIARLRYGSPATDDELLVAGILGTAAVGVDQWLAGGLDAWPMALLFTLQVMGSAAGLDARARRTHLGAIIVAALAPVAYGDPGRAEVIAGVVLVVLLVVEAGLLADFGARVRSQQIALMEAEQRASRQAVTDALTGLSNRRALIAELAGADERLAAGELIDVVYLDLDGFKAYNDEFGHGAGDALLQRLGAALEAAVVGRGRAFRVGGDEFCVLLEGSDDRDEAVADIVFALSEHGAGFSIRPSVGVARMPHEARDPDVAIRIADERMYADKQSRRTERAA